MSDDDDSVSTCSSRTPRSSEQSEKKFNPILPCATIGFPHESPISCLALSHNDRLLAIGTAGKADATMGDSSITVFDLKATSSSSLSTPFQQVGQPIRAHEPERAPPTGLMSFPIRRTMSKFGVKCLAFNPRDSTQIASGGGDNVILIHNTRTRQQTRMQRRHVSVGAIISSVAFTPDGKTLVASAVVHNAYYAARSLEERPFTILTFDVKTQLETTAQQYAYVGRGMAVFPEDSSFVSGSTDIAICSLVDDSKSTKGLVLRGMPTDTDYSWATADIVDVVSCVAVSPCGRFVAAGADKREKQLGSDFEFRVWSAQSGAEVHLGTSRSAVTAISFTVSSSHVLVGCADGSVTSMRVDSGELNVLSPFLPVAPPPLTQSANKKRLKELAKQRRQQNDNNNNNNNNNDDSSLSSVPQQQCRTNTRRQYFFGLAVPMPPVTSLRVTARYVVTGCEDATVRVFLNPDTEFLWRARVWVLKIRYLSTSRWKECFAIWNVLTTVGLFLSFENAIEMRKGSYSRAAAAAAQ